jgi:hypothetical protein
MRTLTNIEENYENRNAHLLARLKVPINNRLSSFDNGKYEQLEAPWFWRPPQCKKKTKIK